ncbi:DNA gyrase inhibitor YacG [Eilatimonas milleporae]|uniref:DNA gyrase inhibitor YacG n=1 Tax=Eilatimonas milleporae TaxID=911205 RepID=A0A3M0C2T3_9PROT|nr:DNA gyrase inhibitor YacG [Eilatimonas milleporae]RMB01479.1 hypothetical protein BXY39_3664 [Eilatimonas milleporae]
MTSRTPEKPAPAKPCPQCGKPATARYRPFCSKRCADIDLGRWLSEDYVLPGNTNARAPEDDDNGL